MKTLTMSERIPQGRRFEVRDRIPSAVPLTDPVQSNVSGLIDPGVIFDGLVPSFDRLPKAVRDAVLAKLNGKYTKAAGAAGLDPQGGTHAITDAELANAESRVAIHDGIKQIADVSAAWQHRRR